MKLIHLISSPGATLVLLLLYAMGLGVATWVEKESSTEMARLFFYNSPWFFLLQLLLCFNFAGMMWRFGYHKQRKWAMIAFHAAFIVILAGAMTTFLWGEEGIIHVREGNTTDEMTVHRRFSRKLPFSVTLKEFRLVRYPGSNSPSSYESDLIITQHGKQTEERVFMNNVAKVGSYRLYQSSFDKDEQGTVLSVSNDPYGMAVSYAGYFLLMIGMVLTLLSPNSRFRTLARKLSDLSGQARYPLLSVLLFAPLWLSAMPEGPLSPGELNGWMVPSAQADRFGRLLVQNPAGRIEPVDTYSGELLRKFSRKGSFEGFSSNQFLIALLTRSEEMCRVPFLYVENKAVAERFGSTGNYLCYNDLFDNRGEYLLTREMQTIYAKEARLRTQTDKALIKLDEKINILYALFHHAMIPLFPLENDPGHKWFAPGDDLSGFTPKDSMFVARIVDWYAEEVNKALKGGTWTEVDEIVAMIDTYQHAKSPLTIQSGAHLQWELLYNRLDVFKWSFRFYLASGILLLLALLFSFVSSARIWRAMQWVGTAAIVGVFLFQTFGLALRWMISGHAPWANAYESMVFVAWSAVFAGLIFVRRSPVAFAVSAVLGGFVLLVSELNFMDPQITPLVPVLKSYWLMVHVAVIMSSYGFFGMGAFLGIMNFVLMIFRNQTNRRVLDHKIEELTLVNEMSLILGLILMTAGTFLGAIWANESWGRYWGWDPKETWALVTMIVYALVLHARFIPRLRGVFVFNLMSVVALSSVLMTYFGVNYYLSGLHSYGRSEALPVQIIQYGTLAVTVIILLAAFRQRAFKR